jgi:uncharacterized protein
LKLHQDTSGALNTVTGYGPDYVDVNLQRHEGSVIVLPGAPVRDWPVASFDALAPEHFAMLLEPAPELVIFGSGAGCAFRTRAWWPRSRPSGSAWRRWISRPPAAPTTS